MTCDGQLVIEWSVLFGVRFRCDSRVNLFYVEVVCLECVFAMTFDGQFVLGGSVLFGVLFRCRSMVN